MRDKAKTEKFIAEIESSLDFSKDDLNQFYDQLKKIGEGTSTSISSGDY